MTAVTGRRFDPWMVRPSTRKRKQRMGRILRLAMGVDRSESRKKAKRTPLKPSNFTSDNKQQQEWRGNPSAACSNLLFATRKDEEHKCKHDDRQ